MKSKHLYLLAGLISASLIGTSFANTTDTCPSPSTIKINSGGYFTDSDTVLSGWISTHKAQDQYNPAIYKVNPSPTATLTGYNKGDSTFSGVECSYIASYTKTGSTQTFVLAPTLKYKLYQTDGSTSWSKLTPDNIVTCDSTSTAGCQFNIVN